MFRTCFFADDALVFANDSKRNLKSLMSFISDYELFSRQKINSYESVFLTLESTESQKVVIKSVTGLCEGTSQLHI